jgi:hypothetical protein
MRRAKSYSIIDHQLFQGGYFEKLDHSALALYLFLVTVSDKNGRSFYSEREIAVRMRMGPNSFKTALKKLIEAHLVSYQEPNFWINNLTHPKRNIQTPANSQRSLPKIKDLLKNR